VEPDFARIAFVTRAYPRMRLAILNIGAAPALIWWLRCVRQDETAEGALAILTLVACLWSLRLGPEQWLDRRFGRVVPPDTDTAWSWRRYLPLIAGVILWRTEDWAQQTGGPPVIMLALTALSVRIFVRDWPYRPYTLIFTVVCALASAVLIAERGNPDLLAWRMRADAAAILAWMMIGLGDLTMLFRVMPRHAGATEHESHADPL
jgi:hypothetical protein